MLVLGLKAKNVVLDLVTQILGLAAPGFELTSLANISNLTETTITGTACLARLRPENG